MRTALAIFLTLWVTGAVAQTPTPAPPDRNCPPEARRNAPGSAPSDKDLSDKLADTGGVICPPGVDHEMTQPPPAGGAIKVVPPPGSPGGNPNVQPNNRRPEWLPPADTGDTHNRLNASALATNHGGPRVALCLPRSHDSCRDRPFLP